MTDIPGLRTERLTLRGHRRDDFDAFAALWADPDVTRYISGEPLARPEAWRRLLATIGHWTLLGFGQWLIEETATGRAVGQVGFLDMQRGTIPDFSGAPEIGWVLAPWAHGCGMAREAAGSALDWGAKKFGPVRCVCIIDPDNAPSLRLAARLGFADAGKVDHGGQDVVLLDRVLTPSPAPS